MDSAELSDDFLAADVEFRDLISQFAAILGNSVDFGEEVGERKVELLGGEFFRAVLLPERDRLEGLELCRDWRAN
jgi:hypothetical protein